MSQNGVFISGASEFNGIHLADWDNRLNDDKELYLGRGVHINPYYGSWRPKSEANETPLPEEQQQEQPVPEGGWWSRWKSVVSGCVGLVVTSAVYAVRHAMSSTWTYIQASVYGITVTAATCTTTTAAPTWAWFMVALLAGALASLAVYYIPWGSVYRWLAARQHNSHEGSGSLPAIPSQPDHTPQQVPSNSSRNGTETSSNSRRKRQRTASDDGSNEENNTDTAIEPSPQDPVRGYISWLTDGSTKVQEQIDSSQELDDCLKHYQELRRRFLSRKGEHDQKLDTLGAQLCAIQKDEQDNIAIRNVLQPIIQRRGTDCAEEWRAALNRCNKSLQLIETRKAMVTDQISQEKDWFVRKLEEYDRKISGFAENIEAQAPDLAQDKRTKRAIHIMKELVEMGESGMATWTDDELDSLEKWIGRLTARKPIEDSD
ncbi:hypothetical protein ACHAPI_006057 [Fusarium lateritium]